MASSDFFSGYDDDDKTVIRPTPGGRRGRLATRLSARPAVPAAMPAGHMDQMQIAGANPLIEAAYPLLSLVTRLRRLPRYDDVQQLRDKMIHALRGMDALGQERGIAVQEIDTARLFLCSLIDEAVLNTPWGNSSGWAGSSLSSYFFKEAWGGEKFFQILSQLKGQPGRFIHLLELGHLCLSLGFEGKYRYTSKGPYALEEEREALYRAIRSQRDAGDPPLSPQWRGIREAGNPIARHLPIWVLAVVSAAVVMLAYLGFNLTMGKRTEQVYRNLVAAGEAIEAQRPIQTLPLLKTALLPSAHTDRYRQLLAAEIAARKAEIVQGPTVRLFDIFASGQATTKAADLPILAKLAGALAEENTRITIVGHTDNQKISISSRFPSNWHLSKQRAENAARLLVAYGVANRRIRVVAKGDGDPIAPNDSASNRARNRRLDIEIR